MDELKAWINAKDYILLQSWKPWLREGQDSRSMVHGMEVSTIQERDIKGRCCTNDQGDR